MRIRMRKRGNQVPNLEECVGMASSDVGQRVKMRHSVFWLLLQQ